MSFFAKSLPVTPSLPSRETLAIPTEPPLPPSTLDILRSVVQAKAYVCHFLNISIGSTLLQCPTITRF